MSTKIVDGKVVVFKSTKNTPSLGTIRDVYAKIPDDKKIPIVFETKKQYVSEYVKNQEKARGKPFPKRDVDLFKKKELKNMDNVVSRYTTKKNPYMEPRTVFFTDYKLTPIQFKKSAVHEYGHEEWERNKALRLNWKRLSTKSPTSYGNTDRQEDFAESLMLYKQGLLKDPSRSNIIRDTASYNKEKQLDIDKAIVHDMFRKLQSGDPDEGIAILNKRIGMEGFFKKGTGNDLSEFDVNHDGRVDDKDIEIIKKDKTLIKDLKGDTDSGDSVADAIGLNVPVEWQATSSWKVWGAPKSYDPRTFEGFNIRSNIARISGEHYKALGTDMPNAYNLLLRNRWLTGSDSGIVRPYSFGGITSDQYGQDLSLGDVGKGIGKVAAFTKQRLSKENIKRTYSGQDRPNLQEIPLVSKVLPNVTWKKSDQKIRLTKPIRSGLKWVAGSVGLPVGATIAMGAKNLSGSSVGQGYAEQTAVYDKQLAEIRAREATEQPQTEQKDTQTTITESTPVELKYMDSTEPVQYVQSRDSNVVDTSMMPNMGPSIGALETIPKLPYITKKEYSFQPLPSGQTDKWYYT